PMFNFIYRDGHQMLTMGGMVGTQVERRRLRGSGLVDECYFRKSFDDDPCVIKVPRLTRKERHYLDQFMPCKDSWSPREFELAQENVLAYRDIYRYCPTYAELML